MLINWKTFGKEWVKFDVRFYNNELLMKLAFVGDLCFGRHIREEYESNNSQFIPRAIVERIKTTNSKVIANLESPVSEFFQNQNMQFCGNPGILEQFKWIDCFSLANNHINDFGEEAIESTVRNLDNYGISYNGIYRKEYQPYLIEEGDCKIAVICCAPRVNVPFAENCKFRLLQNNDSLLYETINKYKTAGYLVIVYTHMGSMFCSYPNPSVFESTHKLIDAGCDCVFVSHPHCIGGIYKYKDVPVFYSLGDFLMDGASFRRRQAFSVSLDIKSNEIVNWDIIPTITTKDLRVDFPKKHIEKKILKRISKVADRIEKNQRNYNSFYKWQYKKDIIKHSLSTMHFLYSTEGIAGLVKTIKGSKGMSLRFKHGSSAAMISKETESGHYSLRNFEK